MCDQASNSDKAIQALQDGFERWNSTKALNTESLQKISALLKLCLALPKWREQLTERAISVSDCISYYSHQLVGLMLQLMVEIA